MKKLLTILGAAGLVATTGATVVACGPTTEKSEPVEFTQANIENMVKELSSGDKRIVFKVNKGISKDPVDGKPSELKQELTKQMLDIFKANNIKEGKLAQFSMNRAPSQSQLDEGNWTWNSEDYGSKDEDALLIFQIGENDKEFRVPAKFSIEISNTLQFNEANIKETVTKMAESKEGIVFHVPNGIKVEGGTDEKPSELKIELTKQILSLLKKHNVADGELVKFSMNKAPNQKQLTEGDWTWNSEDYVPKGDKAVLKFQIGKDDKEFKVDANYSIVIGNPNPEA